MVQDYQHPVRVHKHTFEMVMAAYERRFPSCPQIPVVVECVITDDNWSEDDSRRDTTRRCQLNVEAPYLLKKMVGVDYVYFIQKNSLDLKKRVLEIEATNETFASRLGVVEKCKYYVHPENPEWTCFELSAFLDVKNFFGLESTVEKIAMKQYAANIAKGKELIDIFMEEVHADNVRNLKPWRKGEEKANRNLRRALSGEPLTPCLSPQGSGSVRKSSSADTSEERGRKPNLFKLQSNFRSISPVAKASLKRLCGLIKPASHSNQEERNNDNLTVRCGCLSEMSDNLANPPGHVELPVETVSQCPDVCRTIPILSIKSIMPQNEPSGGVKVSDSPCPSSKVPKSPDLAKKLPEKVSEMLYYAEIVQVSSYHVDKVPESTYPPEEQAESSRSAEKIPESLCPAEMTVESTSLAMKVPEPPGLAEKVQEPPCLAAKAPRLPRIPAIVSECLNLPPNATFASRSARPDCSRLAPNVSVAPKLIPLSASQVKCAVCLRKNASSASPKLTILSGVAKECVCHPKSKTVTPPPIQLKLLDVAPETTPPELLEPPCVTPQSSCQPADATADSQPKLLKLPVVAPGTKSPPKLKESPGVAPQSPCQPTDATATNLAKSPQLGGVAPQFSCQPTNVTDSTSAKSPQVTEVSLQSSCQPTNVTATTLASLPQLPEVAPQSTFQPTNATATNLAKSPQLPEVEPQSSFQPTNATAASLEKSPQLREVEPKSSCQPSNATATTLAKFPQSPEVAPQSSCQPTNATATTLAKFPHSPSPRANLPQSPLSGPRQTFPQSCTSPCSPTRSRNHGPMVRVVSRWDNLLSVLVCAIVMMLMLSTPLSIFLGGSSRRGRRRR